MPEGPSIVLVAEALAKFEMRKARQVTGNASIDIQRLAGEKLEFVLSWGKHLLLVFGDFFIRVHFLMFGSWRVDERKDVAPRLSLQFPNGEVNFYNCSVRLIEGTPFAVYDWRTDVMSDLWEGRYVHQLVKQLPSRVLVSDVILNQEIFSGAGNIIKNEVLWRIRVDPRSEIGELSEVKLKQLVKDVRDYSLLFYAWKKEFVLKKNWMIYKKSNCPRCGRKTIREYIGRMPRLTCYCSVCQKLYHH